MQHILLKIGEENYLVRVDKVEKILEEAEITPVPQAPSFVDGVINYEGTIVVVGNPLQLKYKKGNWYILIEHKKDRWVLRADEVGSLINFEEKDMGSLPNFFPDEDAPFFKGILNKEDQVYLVLDIDYLFEYLKKGE